MVVSRRQETPEPFLFTWSSRNFIFAFISPAPHVPWEQCETAQVGSALAVTLYASQRNPIIRNTGILKGSHLSLPKPWPQGSYYPDYFGQQTNMPSALEKDILSASHINLIHRFEKIVWNKNFQCLCSDVQKSKKSTGNYLPTVIITFCYFLCLKMWNFPQILVKTDCIHYDKWPSESV